jgi:hypothetical protein
MPSRRSYLAGLGSLGCGFSLAGCLGDEPAATETTRSPTPTPEVRSFGNEATVGGATMTPSAVHPQSSFVWVADDWADVLRLGDQWVAFVRLSVGGDPEAAPPRGAFSLVADDTSFVARERLGEAPVGLVSPDEAVAASPYDPTDRSEGWLAFTVPSGFESASDLRLWLEHDGDTAQWSVPSEATARLAGPRPTFEVTSFDVPERVSSSETAEVTVTARNTGDVHGVFRGCVNTTGMYSFSSIERPLEVGAETTWTETLQASHYAPGGGTFTCNLRTAGDDERERAVEVVADGTSTTTPTTTETTTTGREQS